MTTKTLLFGALANLALGTLPAAAQERPPVPAESRNTNNDDLRMRAGSAQATSDAVPLRSFWLHVPEVTDAVIVGGAGEGSGG